MQKISHLINTNRNLLFYILIGMSGVIIDLIVYIGLVKVGLDPLIASFISVSCGVVNNFFWNAYVNFKKTDHLFFRFLAFFAVGTMGTVLGLFMIFLLHDIYKLDPIYAKLISIPFVVAFQYWFNKSASFSADKSSIPWNKMLLFFFSLSVVIFFVGISSYGSFTDEYDNLLGAQIILHGGLIYQDYFSHHMPLVYFMAVPFFAIVGTNLIGIKVLFGIVFGAWLLLMSRHLYKKYGSLFFYIFVSFISIIQLPGWSHMLVAESFIGLAVLHALILFMTAKSRDSSPNKDVVVYAALGAVPALTALPYLPLSLLIYGLCLAQILLQFRKKSFPWIRSAIIGSVAALLPYIVFVTYLVVTNTLALFITQAIKFNSLYYSQFTPQAPQNAVDAALSIVSGSFGSLYAALTFNPLQPNSPIAFAFALAALIGITHLLLSKKYILTSIYIGALVLSSSRAGFTSVLAEDGSARNATALTYVILLFSLLIVWDILKTKKKLKLPGKQLGFKYAQYLIVPCLVLIGIYGAVHTIDGMRRLNNDRAYASLQPPIDTGSTSHIVNLITRPGDTYWIGPFDFKSQLFITQAQNVSSYRFYLPWHSICQECSAQLVKNIEVGKPVVIYMDTKDSIWGHPTSVYAKTLLDSFKDNYYTLSDPQLKGFYFLRTKQDQIDTSLKAAGYNIETTQSKQEPSDES